jgi:hypothetical protein
MLGILEYTGRLLEENGYRPLKDLCYAHAAIAAAHITGFEPLYDYPVEVYYELMDAAEESALYTPRWYPHYKALEEEVEALAAFEEALADSKRVFHAEPLLAAAALAFGCRLRIGRCWVESGYAPAPGQQVVIVYRGGRREKITVPKSLYTLTLAGLSLYNVEPAGGEALVAVPDPAVIRREVFEEKPPYEEASAILRLTVEKHARKVCLHRAEDSHRWACGEEDVLLIKYRFEGPSVVYVEYVTC